MFGGVFGNRGGRKRRGRVMEDGNQKRQCEELEVESGFDLVEHEVVGPVASTSSVGGGSGLNFSDVDGRNPVEGTEGAVFGEDVEGDAQMYALVSELAAREINKADVLEIGVVYQLCDVYTVNVNNERLAPVGGVRKEGNLCVTYIWLPSKLFLNAKTDVELQSVIDKLKKGIEENKFVYILSKGKGVSRNGFDFHDVNWYQLRK